jgi:hypothetical protein
MVTQSLFSIVGALKFFPSYSQFLESFLPSDPTFYGDQFVFYANHHVRLWAGLSLVAIILIQSIIRKRIRPC